MTTEVLPTQEVDLSRVVADAAFVAEWNALASRGDDASYFRSADWVCSWWETVAARPPTRVATWRDDDGRLCALAAISAGRERLHRRARFNLSVGVARVAGSGPGDADHCG
ncbi:MAG: hypothetical protein QOI55_1868, partial [Actinomycetota bacterium]|nr:hypothetical protein [Actinomycetota bacterium]